MSSRERAFFASLDALIAALYAELSVSTPAIAPADRRRLTTQIAMAEHIHDLATRAFGIPDAPAPLPPAPLDDGTSAPMWWGC